MKEVIQLHQLDNVAIALAPLSKGTTYAFDGQTLTPQQDVEKGHKVALTDIAEGQNVIKYGAPIGYASQAIKAGEWVHTDNVKTNLSDELEYAYQPEDITSQFLADDSPEVQLYRRKSGDVGIRNELWIIPTVGCVNGMAAQMVKEFKRQHQELAIDGVHVFPHQFGCSQLGDDLKTTQVLLQNMAKHPNAGAVLVVGLGCENNQVVMFEDGLGDYDKDRVKFLVTQMVEDEVEAGVELMNEMYQHMRHDKRQPGRLSEVKFGLELSLIHI